MATANLASLQYIHIYFCLLSASRDERAFVRRPLLQKNRNLGKHHVVFHRRVDILSVNMYSRQCLLYRQREDNRHRVVASEASCKAIKVLPSSAKRGRFVTCFLLLLLFSTSVCV
jgi:hypothetical protein